MLIVNSEYTVPSKSTNEIIINKIMKISFLIFLTAISLLLSSCNPLKKDVMKDIADDIKETVIIDSENGQFLVVQEEVFQATSKSDKGGFRQITGYNENRITSYDLNTGQISKRIKIGEPRENEIVFLGKADGKLWYKSINPELGFHAREPRSLEVVVTQEKFTEVNPFLKNNLSLPEWNSITRYYGFNVEKGMPLVTDKAGFIYEVDPVSLKAEKMSGSIEQFDFDNSCTSSSISIDPNNNVYLKGSPRVFIDYRNKEIKEPSFLKGEFLMSSNILSPQEANQNFLNPYRDEIQTYKREIDSLNELINAIDTTSGSDREKLKSRWEVHNALRNINYAKDRIVSVEKQMKMNDEQSYSLITGDNCVFVMSQTDVTDQAKIIISKVKLNSDSTVNLVWQTEIKDVYRDPDKGLDRSSFEVVFSKGSPNFRTMRAISGNGKLIFAFMLKATCIDIESGRILWQTNL